MSGSDVLGPIIVIVVILGVWFFVKGKEATHEERLTKDFVNRTSVQMEKDKLDLQKEELKLKQQILELQKQKMLDPVTPANAPTDLPRLSAKHVDADYTVKDDEK